MSALEITNLRRVYQRGGGEELEALRGVSLEVHLGVDPDFRPRKKGHPGILVREIDALARHLASAGHAVTWDDLLPGYRRFYVDDNNGNRLEFLTESRSGG